MTSQTQLCIIDHDLPNGYRGPDRDGALPKMYEMTFVRNRIWRHSPEIGIRTLNPIFAKVPIVKIELDSGLQADINCNEQLGESYTGLNPAILNCA